MKQRTLTLCKNMSIMVLTLMMAIVLVGISGISKVYAEGTITAGFDSDEKKIVAVLIKTQQKTTKYSVVLEIKSGSDWLDAQNHKGVGTSYDSDSFDITVSGTYRVKVQELDYNNETLVTSYSDEILVDLGDGGNSGKNGGSIDSSNPTAVALPSNDSNTNLSWTQTATGGSKNKVYYKLEVAEKTYYHFSYTSLVTGILYKGDSVSGEVAVSSTSLFGVNDEHLLDKGTYLLEMYGITTGDQCSVDIKSRDFKDLKSINVASDIQLKRGEYKLIDLNPDPSDYESNIKVTGSAVVKNPLTEEEAPKGKIFLYGDSIGDCTATVTTSEGVVLSVKFKTNPNITAVSLRGNSTTSSKKTAKAKIYNVGNGGDANYYKYYLKSGSTWKIVKEQSADSFTYSVKPGTKLTMKVEACYRDASGNIISSVDGNAVEILTAPYKAPKLKSAKQSGNTKYVKPYTKTEKVLTGKYGWEYVTRHYGNSSNATVKLSYTKVKGAKYYEPNKGYTDGISIGPLTDQSYLYYVKNNKLSFTYSGKIKGKTEKVRIRAVFVNGNSVAYGPWTAYKKVKIKAAK